MPLSLISNMASMSALRYLNINNQMLNQSLERLSSGYRINHASDDAAGLMVSESMLSQINGYDTATSNSQQGLSMLQTADGALQQINNHLQNIRDIAVAASNGTTSASQFSAYQANLQAELASIDSIASNTKYGSSVLLDGSVGATFNLQIGANSGDTMNIATAFSNNKSNLGLSITQNTLSSTANATTLMGQVNTALGTVANNLATIGQFENSVQDQMNYLSIAKENTSSAEAAIRDTDVAAETANVARLQLLQQTDAYALTQANSSNSIISHLLQ